MLFSSHQPGRAGLRAALKALEGIHAYLLVSGRERIIAYTSRPYWNKLLQNSLDFSEFLYTIEGPDRDAAKILADWSDIYNDLHRELCHYHLTKPNEDGQVASAIHYLVDTYYHIATKFISKKDCKWCNTDIRRSWAQLLSDEMLKTPLAVCKLLNVSSDPLIGIVKTLLVPEKING